MKKWILSPKESTCSCQERTVLFRASIAVSPKAVWLMYNTDAQLTLQEREEAQTGRENKFKFFLSCHKRWILFPSHPIRLLNKAQIPGQGLKPHTSVPTFVLQLYFPLLPPHSLCPEQIPRVFVGAESRFCFTHCSPHTSSIAWHSVDAQNGNSWNKGRRLPCPLQLLGLYSPCRSRPPLLLLEIKAA